VAIKKVVVLARGLGNRMRAENFQVNLNSEQQKVAEIGVKALIPITKNRTFLDFIVENLRNTGFTEICLVIGDEHEILKNFCRRNNLQFAIQKEPLGTSDAVFSAKDFVKNDKFLVVNSDNLYPIEALQKLQQIENAGLIAFHRNGLISESNISADKIKKFATVDFDDDGILQKIIEKPQFISEKEIYISMNAWVFSPKIFDACQQIEKSERGEFELTAAVQFAIDNLGEKFRVETYNGGVLDLSSREDIEKVIKKLAQNE
jgi:dTDP-glucose pyrophosphorylase